jgi:hypothetical protein
MNTNYSFGRMGGMMMVALWGGLLALSACASADPSSPGPLGESQEADECGHEFCSLDAPDCCNEVCTNTNTDPLNCGVCGNSCGLYNCNGGGECYISCITNAQCAPPYVCSGGVCGL